MNQDRTLLSIVSLLQADGTPGGKGIGEAIIDAEFAAVVDDLRARGADGKARTVTVRVTFTPEVHAGEVRGVAVAVQASSGLPKQQSAPLRCKLGSAGGRPVLVLADDPQLTLIDKTTGEVRKP